MMRITLIVARARNGVIGRAGALPWSLPADMRHFRARTMGRPVVMGRRTFDSIGRALPGRRTIVLTRDIEWHAPWVLPAYGWAGAKAAAAGAEELMVAGGAEIYALALPEASQVELTEVDAYPAGDARIPGFAPQDWEEVARTQHPATADQPGFAIVTLRRRRPPG